VTGRPALSGAAGALVIAFSAILVRLAHVSPETAAVFRCVYALPALGLLAWIERQRYGPRGSRDRLVALSAGVFFAIDLICWHHSIAAVGAGLATVLATCRWCWWECWPGCCSASAPSGAP
jgi:drug/metabolite transporter (DMT)-like permease